MCVSVCLVCYCFVGSSRKCSQRRTGPRSEHPAGYHEAHRGAPSLLTAPDPGTAHTHTHTHTHTCRNAHTHAHTSTLTQACTCYTYTNFLLLSPSPSLSHTHAVKHTHSLQTPKDSSLPCPPYLSVTRSIAHTVLPCFTEPEAVDLTCSTHFAP